MKHINEYSEFKKSLNEGLTEAKKIKIGQQFNADGITWKVIKVGATQSRAEAITKSAKKKQGTYDNKTISKFVEGKLNEGPGKGYYIEVAVRDARKALAILDDMYRKKFDINASNVYYF